VAGGGCSRCDGMTGVVKTMGCVVAPAAVLAFVLASSVTCTVTREASSSRGQGIFLRAGNLGGVGVGLPTRWRCVPCRPKVSNRSTVNCERGGTQKGPGALHQPTVDVNALAARLSRRSPRDVVQVPEDLLGECHGKQRCDTLVVVFIGNGRIAECKDRVLLIGSSDSEDSMPELCKQFTHSVRQDPLRFCDQSFVSDVSMVHGPWFVVLGPTRACRRDPQTTSSRHRSPPPWGWRIR
jgi:hypothetical protein